MFLNGLYYLNEREQDWTSHYKKVHPNALQAIKHGSCAMFHGSNLNWNGCIQKSGEHDKCFTTFKALPRKLYIYLSEV